MVELVDKAGCQFQKTVNNDQLFISIIIRSYVCAPFTETVALVGPGRTVSDVVARHLQDIDVDASNVVVRCKGLAISHHGEPPSTHLRTGDVINLFLSQDHCPGGAKGVALPAAIKRKFLAAVALQIRAEFSSDTLPRGDECKLQSPGEWVTSWHASDCTEGQASSAQLLGLYNRARRNGEISAAVHQPPSQKKAESGDPPLPNSTPQERREAVKKSALGAIMGTSRLSEDRHADVETFAGMEPSSLQDDIRSYLSSVREWYQKEILRPEPKGRKRGKLAAARRQWRVGKNQLWVLPPSPVFAAAGDVAASNLPLVFLATWEDWPLQNADEKGVRAACPKCGRYDQVKNRGYRWTRVLGKDGFYYALTRYTAPPPPPPPPRAPPPPPPQTHLFFCISRFVFALFSCPDNFA